MSVSMGITGKRLDEVLLAIDRGWGDFLTQAEQAAVAAELSARRNEERVRQQELNFAKLGLDEQVKLLAEKREAIEALTRDRDAAQEAVAKWQDEVEHLKKQLHSSDHSRQILGQDLKRTRFALSERASEVDRARVQLRAVKQERDATFLKLAEVEDRLEKRLSDNNAVPFESFEELRHAHQMANAKLRDSDERLQSLRDAFESRGLELEGTRRHLESTQSMVAMANDRHAEMETRVRDLAAELEKSGKESGSRMAAIKGLQARIRTDNEAIHDADAKIEELTAELSESTAARQALADGINEWVEKYQKLHEELLATQATIDSDRNTIRRLADQVKELAGDLAATRKAAADIRHEHRGTLQQLDTCIGERNAARAMIEELREPSGGFVHRLKEINREQNDRIHGQEAKIKALLSDKNLLIAEKDLLARRLTNAGQDSTLRQRIVEALNG